MDFFDKYTSNTIAASGNQRPRDFTSMGQVCTRIFYRLTVGGTFDYSLLFSNINDSTFDNGAEGYKNRVYDPWVIHSLKVSIWERGCFDGKFSNEEHHVPLIESKMGKSVTVTFNGHETKHVSPGEFFRTDPVSLTAEKGEYLCVELTFEGGLIPCYDEFLAPVYMLTDGEWRVARCVPAPGMIGAARDVRARVGFIGDSITCGCGTEPDAYAHWNALLTDRFDEDFAFRNLGLGYGRAEDVASGGAWFYKARHNEAIVVCFGVNDILQGRDENAIKADLAAIVKRFKAEGMKVLLQTVPPFDYVGENIGKWHRINDYIKNTLAGEADMIFDNVPVLWVDSEHPHMAKYDGHPDHEGCRKWADALYPVMKEFLRGL